ncbi:uncharacterized protein ASCRUDRAFT_77018 [Ascoidea rubescens DSM 1968]|uniref:Inositol-pentakisphosphate 2-kinase n=1 Tax=Ascoidea rubescens DSM 1968 TaxID=1344418 RepID=A0A1D2VDL7_9ASCO|nr:hypothetical protein ASCRUDRAFT_77009 [Ascoidea rubescens DSM 1968]XP_020045979.1 hypothetical protein ASCRUDRAFT_77018 [Ascoidea rubescens DSM 1968]ODV59666.1 hypothetical protein ASCRUDRAFT_77009 [Ascoidea rubescens DSM 1968]ODV59672.1 hypothetical protein ASCRUDRAFT_77018 [Ascoidea rubescens DSM 1968]
MDLFADEWEYLDNGMANAVFKYVGNNTKYLHRVLRVRLIGQHHQSASYISTAEVFDSIHASFVADRSLCNLREYIVNNNFELIELPTVFTEALTNTFKNHCSINLDERYGMLIDNHLVTNEHTKKTKYSKFLKLFINTTCDSGDFPLMVIEMKPKWLYKDSIDTNYCRNCAYNRMTKKITKKCFCFNELIKFKDSNLKQTLKNMFPISNDSNNDIVVDSTEIAKNILFDYFNYNDKNILNMLSLYQRPTTHNMILNLSEEFMNSENNKQAINDLNLKMTLRDVTVFIKFYRIVDTAGYLLIDLDTSSSSSTYHKAVGHHQIAYKWQNRFYCIEISLVDLDLKDIAGKWRQWKAKESSLVAGDWYNTIDVHYGQPCCVLLPENEAKEAIPTILSG